VKGLVFDPRPLRLAAAGVLGRLRPVAALSSIGPLSLREVPEPVLPGPGWVALQPQHAGICGSDVTQATLQADWDNPLSGLVSFPHVMGHEVAARVLDPGATELADGEVVVLNPWLGCAARGLPACSSCLEGLVPLCVHGGEPIPGIDGAGIHTGNIRGLPGGMGELMVAHRSQLRRLPAGLDPRAAVLADPLAVGLHAAQRAMQGMAAAERRKHLAGGSGRTAVARRAPGPQQTAPPGLAVVLGAGTIGLATAAALRHLGVGDVLVSTAWRYQTSLVLALGATPVDAAAAPVVTEVARRTDGRLTRPWRGLPWLVAGGAAAVVDAVGSAAMAELALAIVRPGGTVVRVGVGRARRTQATLTYFKEVAVVGSNGYRQEDLDTALGMLAGGAVPWRDWLTHRLDLKGWRDAFRIAAEPQRHAAVKVSLDITGVAR
jgi:threonine dehydrogenase-like Zn-dependent dehydrogenase